MWPTLQDTIVALSSGSNAPGLNGAGACGSGVARSIVRLSGPQAFVCLDAIFEALDAPAQTPLKGSAGARTSSWRRVSGNIRLSGRDPMPAGMPGVRRGALLPASAYLMPGPKSYTRQDVAEIHLPAYAPVLRYCMGALVEAGARPALPGEFTRRALLSGRIGIEQAQALGLLLQAEHAEDARRLVGQVSSHAHAERGKLRQAIEALLMEVEVGLDFSQEEVEVLPREELIGRVRALLGEAERMAQRRGHTEGCQNGGELRVALAGPPNAGKSSLFNALLGRDAALVSAHAHTTRDALEARLELATVGVMGGAPGPAESVSVRLFDLAGWDEAATPEQIRGQAQAQMLQTLRSADLILLAHDRQQPQYIKEACAELLARIAPHAPPVWCVATKADLPPGPGWDDSGANAGLFCVSSRTREGLPGLLDALTRQLSAEDSRRRASALGAAEAASTDATFRAQSALRQALDGLQQGLGEDALAVELREALHALAAGERTLLKHDAVTEALLDQIFSTFCIGK